MYHAVGRPVQTPQDTFLNVSEESFRKQMRVLNRLGYRARRFEEVVEALHSGRSLPPRTFAATFDDAYSCVLECAAPILSELRFTATVFAVSNWSHPFRSANERPEGLPLQVMDWEALKTLQTQGWEVGGHTRTHVHLDELEDSAAFEEILQGKLECEASLDTPLTSFCFPFGHLNSNTVALVQKAGFRGACTVRSGVARKETDPYLIPRVKIGYRDGVYGLLYRMLVRPNLPTFRSDRRSEQIKNVSGKAEE